MRDPGRIPLMLAAVERQWRKEPDQRLGQLIVNLLRDNRDILRDAEGRALFDVQDSELLGWLGPETEEEETYVREEPRKAREAWRAWEQSFRESGTDGEWH